MEECGQINVIEYFIFDIFSQLQKRTSYLKLDVFLKKKWEHLKRDYKKKLFLGLNWLMEENNWSDL